MRGLCEMVLHKFNFFLGSVSMMLAQEAFSFIADRKLFLWFDLGLSLICGFWEWSIGFVNARG